MPYNRSERVCGYNLREVTMPNKPVNETFKVPGKNKVFDEKHHSLINVQGIGTKRVETAAGPVQFEDNFAVLPSDGMANEIEAELQAGADHPGRVKMIRRDKHSMDRIHRYHFGSPAGGWPAFDENGRIINGT